MLAIRMQRTGRRGHAQFRMIVQDSRFHPSSGRVVAYLGNYDPHTKESSFDKEKLESYLANGAQPSPRVIRLLKKEKIKMPAWVKEPDPKKGAVRNPEKRRSTMPEKPAEEVQPDVAETPAAEEAPVTEEAQPEAEEASTEQAPAETASEQEQPLEEAETPAEPQPKAKEEQAEEKSA